jgi:hypothetical protein
MELTHQAPGPEQAYAVLLAAIQTPQTGAAHRPTEVQVRREEWQAALAPRLGPLGVRCVTEAALEEIDAVFEGLGGCLAQAGRPGLLDMPGVTPEAVGSFFDAAALFAEQAPWLRVGERPIEVRCPRFESGPWYAVILGQGGMVRGLILYDTLEALQRVRRGELSGEESARQTSCLAVVYGPAADLTEVDRLAVLEHGWRVDTPDAYPSVYRLDPGLNTRPPLAWELALLEGCLRALPEFVRKKTRRLGPLTLDVPTASGELPVILSWAADGG